MDTTKSYQYENELNFNIENVKTALKSILKNNNTRFLHSEKDFNDIFNTYHFGEVKCGYLVTLQKIDDNTTKVQITCSSRTGFEISMASLQSYVVEFLNILGAKLSGASDQEMTNIIGENNSDSNISNINALVLCISIVVFGIFMIIMMNSLR